MALQWQWSGDPHRICHKDIHTESSEWGGCGNLWMIRLTGREKVVLVGGHGWALPTSFFWKDLLSGVMYPERQMENQRLLVEHQVKDNRIRWLWKACHTLGIDSNLSAPWHKWGWALFTSTIMCLGQVCQHWHRGEERKSRKRKSKELGRESGQEEHHGREQTCTSSQTQGILCHKPSSLHPPPPPLDHDRD